MIWMLAFVGGVTGGMLHLVCTALRARAATSGSPGRALLAGPLGLLGPASAVSCSLSVDPQSVWAVLAGLLAARALGLGPLAHRLEGAAWTP